MGAIDTLKRLLPAPMKSLLRRALPGTLPSARRFDPDATSAPVLMVSTPFAGSGRSTHGTRHLLHLLGYQPLAFDSQKDSLLADPGYRKAHPIGGWEDAKAEYAEVVVRTLAEVHELPRGGYLNLHLPVCAPELLEFEGLRTIYTMRDPRDMVTSTYHFYRRLYEEDATLNLPDLVSMFTQDERKEEALSTLIEGSFHIDNEELFFHYPSPRELLQFTAQLREHPDVHIIDFEFLHQEPERCFAKLARFLEAGADLPGRISPADCVEAAKLGSIKHRSAGRTASGQRDHYVQEKSGAWIRKGVPGDWSNHFTAAHRTRLDELAGDLLAEAGYGRCG